MNDSLGEWRESLGQLIISENKTENNIEFYFILFWTMRT